MLLHSYVLWSLLHQFFQLGLIRLVILTERVFWRPAQSHVAVINALSILVGFVHQGSPLVKWNYVSPLKSSCGAVSRRRYTFLMENVCENCSRGREEIAEAIQAGFRVPVRALVYGLVCVGCKLWLRQSGFSSEDEDSLSVRGAPALIHHVAFWRSVMFGYLPKRMLVQTKW